MEPNPGDQAHKWPSSDDFWLGAEPPSRYVDITDAIEMKRMEILNRDSNRGSPQTLLKKNKRSALNSTSGNIANRPEIDWVESNVDEQLILFTAFRDPVKIYTIHLTCILPETSDDDDDNDDDNGCLLRPKTIRLYTNRPNCPSFDEADDLAPTQTFELRPSDWDATTGTVKLGLKFVWFQKVSSLVMYVVEGAGLGAKVRLDRMRIFGELPRTRNLPIFLEHGNAATRSRKDYQLAFAVGKKTIIATLPHGAPKGPMNMDAVWPEDTTKRT